jgi:hypothetical protein
MLYEDARLQPGAYVTDGIELFEVRGRWSHPSSSGISLEWVVLENCRDLSELRLLSSTVTYTFELVRPTPSGTCPHTPQDIPRGSRPGTGRRPSIHS